MSHETALIATLTAGLGLAFVLGLAAVRLRLPPLVGYLLAGMVVGPFTPGFVADTSIAGQLAEVGVILLMFGVGLRFSLRELLTVRALVVPGAVLQMVLTEALASAAIPYVVIERDRRIAERLRRDGVPVVFGDAARPAVLAAAHSERARLLVIAAPNAYEARQIVAVSRAANADIATVVRTHHADEQALLERVGVGRVVMGEHELARSMAEYARREYASPTARRTVDVQGVGL